MTAKQARFCEEYVVDLNATQAAIRADYEAGSAHVAGCRLLKNDKVKEEIARLRSKQSERTQVTADAVLADFVTIKEECMDSKNYQPALKALELIAKHLGMFEETVKVRHEVLSTDERVRGISDILDIARERREAARPN